MCSQLLLSILGLVFSSCSLYWASLFLYLDISPCLYLLTPCYMLLVSIILSLLLSLTSPLSVRLHRDHCNGYCQRYYWKFWQIYQLLRTSEIILLKELFEKYNLFINKTCSELSFYLQNIIKLSFTVRYIEYITHCITEIKNILILVDSM